MAYTINKNRYGMAKEEENTQDELTLDEAINAVKRLSNPDRPNQELELLKEASAKLLEEVQPGFEFEGDDDDGPDAGALKEELTKSPGFFEQMGSQISNIGAAGVIALSSAAYFQIDTVVEETRTVAAVAEEKWEEVKLEHPNINWDDPLAGFTTIIGVGEIEISPEPPKPKGETPNSIDDKEQDSEAEESETSEIKESQEPEPEAEEEQVKEKPKKKSGGLFKSLFGKDDEESEEPEDEPREETTQDDTVPDEQTEEETSEEPKAKANDGEIGSGESTAEPVENSNSEKSNGIEKSSGGGLFSRLFGNSNDAEVEEVVENSEVSPEVSVEASSDEGAPPPITVEQAEVKIDIQELSEGIQTGDIQLSDEPEVNIDSAIENVLTPIDGTVVSPSGPAGFGNLFGPYSPGYDDGESDATPI